MNQQVWALTSFKGRIRRREYWFYSIPVTLIVVAVYFYQAGSHFMLDTIVVALSLFSIWATLALNIKRLHDRNLSAWWVILTFVPLVGPIFVLIELGIRDGTAGANNYGPDPKNRAGSHDDTQRSGLNQAQKRSDHHFDA